MEQPLIFKGEVDSPLLPPRGVCLADGKLFVADTGPNRVFIWHQLPTEDGQAANVVLGQPDFLSNEPNVKGIGQPPNRCTGLSTSA